MATLLFNAIEGEGKIFMVNGPPGQLESLEEEEAFLDMAETFFPQVQIFEEWPMCDVAASLKVAEDFLTVHPDVAGIYAWSAPYNGTGIIEALKAAGYKPGEVKIVGTWAVPATLEALNEGWYEWLGCGQPLTEARISIQNMARMFEGEEVPMVTSRSLLAIRPSVIGKWDESVWFWHE